MKTWGPFSIHILIPTGPHNKQGITPLQIPAHLISSQNHLLLALYKHILYTDHITRSALTYTKLHNFIFQLSKQVEKSIKDKWVQ
jgi:hypothetical protein